MSFKQFLIENESIILSGKKLGKLPEGLPSTVNGDFQCNSCELTTFENCPIKIKGSFACSYNPLIFISSDPFKGCPRIVENNFYCDDNDIKTFFNIDKHIHEIHGSLYLYGTDLSKADNILNILKIKHLQSIATNQICRLHLTYVNILNKYLIEKSGVACSGTQILKCKIELEKSKRRRLSYG